MKRFLLWFGGIVLGMIVLQIVLAETPNDRQMWAILLLLIPIGFVAASFSLGVTFLAVLVHELGHLVAGRRVGMAFRAMYIGPIGVVRRKDGRLGLQWMKNPFMGGLAIMDFPTIDAEFVPKFRRFILGGPVASLLWCAFTSVLAAGVYVWGRPFHSLPLFSLHLLSLSMAVMALLILPGTLSNKPKRGMMTDGFLLKRLEKPGPEVERLIGLFQLSQQIRGGVRARDWDGALIDRGLTLQDGSPEEMQCNLLAYYYKSDLNDVEAAGRHLDRARHLLPRADRDLGIVGQSIMLESTFQAAQRGNVDEAKSLMKRVKSPMSFLASAEHRTKAALLVAEGNGAAALKEIAKSRALLEKHARTMPGDLSPEYERLVSLESQIAAMQASPVPIDRSSEDPGGDDPGQERSSPR